MDIAERNTNARRQEIARRYRRRGQQFHWSIENQRRSDLRKVFRRRQYPAVLSNEEVDTEIERQLGPDLTVWDSPEALGQQIRLTFQEYQSFQPRLKTILPCDVTREVIEEDRKARRRESNRLSARKQRLNKGAADHSIRHQGYEDLSRREESLHRELSGDRRWFTIYALIPKLNGYLAWRGPDGKPLVKASLARAIRRCARNLVKEGKAEISEKKGSRGQRMLTLRALRGHADTRTSG